MKRYSPLQTFVTPGATGGEGDALFVGVEWQAIDALR